MKKLTLLTILFAATVGVAAAQGTATIRASFTGTDRDMIYFDFMEQPNSNMEFPYREGRVIEFDVQLDDITLMKINTFVLVVVQPGDQLDIEVEYEGRNYRNARFSGTSAQSVAASTVLNQIRAMRLSREYKTNMPAAMVIQTPADVFFQTSVQEWKDELDMLDQVRAELTPKVYNFVRSELDAIFIPNIISYPGNTQQEGYWTALDGYRLRDDDASLRNHSYMGMLNTYMGYTLLKQAHDQGTKPRTPESMEEHYARIAEFYDGKLRDAALMVFLYGALASGDDFEAAEALCNDYFANYNIDPRYRKMLNEVMQ